MKKYLTAMCDFCNLSTISIKHILVEHPSLTEESSSLPSPKNLENILEIENFPFLICFLKRTNMYDKILM